MGNYVSSHLNANSEKRGKKRDVSDVQPEEEKVQEQNFQTPKRRKLKSTTKYIYQTLFLNGENSDVTIIAMGREWPLHKVYLCQCGYFASMFSGSWRESEQSVINMDIPDDNIDEEALKIAFGSLYRDDVSIKPANVVSALAAATLLQLEGLICQCAEIMKETISAKTACWYYGAAQMYGQQGVAKKSIQWLEKHVMTMQTTTLLREISIDLMKLLVSSPNLYVMQVEMDVYTMLKKWMFLLCTPTWSGSSKQVAEEADSYFRSTEPPTVYFLETEKGQQYVEAFQCLRFQHLVNDITSTQVLERDRIVPESWLYPWYKCQWHHMLKMEQGLDLGPKDIGDEIFYQTAVRYGRVLKTEKEYCWRWTGYHFGVDLLVTFTNGLLILKRNTYSQECQSSISLQAKRHLAFRVTVSSFDTLGHTEYVKSSGIKYLSLGKDEETVVLVLDRHVTFPLCISLNILYFTPNMDMIRKAQAAMNFDAASLVRSTDSVETASQTGSTSSSNSSIHRDTEEEEEIQGTADNAQGTGLAPNGQQSAPNAGV
ncbi:germ cell-less protein-like 1 [Lingula anatina]|uniref:Germ cell-less protein-like 1 n=1 Tax=Lingula anatina TaxID=7574 RepID=A0A1S3HTS3_LINAN|nr:germ cell-less protein-like 1 [Lingula anatina]|eukprot:XP_013388946.1 germ cell-less protein-like 1 [Lingula anatina]